MNGNLFMAAVSKSDTWEDITFYIVDTWNSNFRESANDVIESGWKADLSVCEPWQFAHMANLTLLVNLPIDFPKDFSDENESAEEIIKNYALSMAKIAIDYDFEDMRAIFEVHTELLGLGKNHIKKGMVAPWPNLTWASFAVVKKTIWDAKPTG